MDTPKSLFFVNGNIITADDHFTVAESMATAGERILAVGTVEEVQTVLDTYQKELLERQGSAVEVREIDLEGKCIVPGFIDTHMHPIIAIYFKSQFSVAGVTNYSDLKAAFEGEFRKRGDGEWIMGIDFLEERFDNPTERFFPSKFELDKITSSQPIALLRHDGHICAANSKGLEIIGLSKETYSDFYTESGQIKLDKSGSPNGIFTEVATSIVLDQIGMPDLTRMREAALEFSRELASFGITTVGGVLQTDEEGPSGAMGTMELPLFQTLMVEDCLLQDYVLYLITAKAKRIKRAAKKIRKLDGGRNQFKVIGMKRFLDGTIGTGTAYLKEAFSDSTDDNRGMLVIDPAALETQMKEAYTLGFQLLCHSIGDRANRIITDIYRRIQSEEVIGGEAHSLQSQCRIEHASILPPDLMHDIAEARIGISTQPVFLESEHPWIQNRVGPNRIRYTYPFRSIIENSILIGGASDAPVESANVLNALGICLHRFGCAPEESLTIKQALRMFTSNAARLIGDDDDKGSLEAGKSADFVILEQNLLEIPGHELKNIQIESTYRRGFPIYHRNPN